MKQFFLIGSHAASPYASISADQGTLTCGATSSADSTASDHNKVTFGACSGGGGGTSPACTDPTRYTTTAAAVTALSSSTSGSVICMSAGTYGSITIQPKLLPLLLMLTPLQYKSPPKALSRLHSKSRLALP